MYTKKRLLSYILIFCVIIGGATAQTVLTMQEAVEIALKNNYDIILVKNDAEAAKINNNAGNAGMLPNLTVNVSENIANTNINQKFTSGLEVNRGGVGSTNLNANIALDWTLFDGMRMFAAKDRLEALQLQSDYTLKEQLQQTTAQVMGSYYGLVAIKMQLKSTEKAIELVKKREEIINTKYAVGVVSSFEVNQVKIDRNMLEANLLLQQNEYKNMALAFNVILARDAGIAITVPDSITMANTTTFPAVEAALADKNFSLLSAQKNISISQLQYKEVSSQRLPLVRLNGSYGYTRQTSEAGFSLLNQSNGLNAGITASVPIFRGNSIRNQLKISTLQIKTSTLLYDRLKSNVDASYRQAYNNYQTYTTTAGMEAANATLALNNYTIAQGRLQQGLSSLLEVKEAERNWQDAQTRHINAQYNQKLAEIELQRLTGGLVK